MNAAHLIIEKAHECCAEGRMIDLIAQNSEALGICVFQRPSFQDSFTFLTASLDKLVSWTKYEHYNHQKVQEHLELQQDWDKNCEV